MKLAERTKSALNTIICKKQHFRAALFIAFIAGVWILDFLRPVYNHFFHMPPAFPNIGEYAHLIYNILFAYLFLILLEKTPRKIPRWLRYLLVIVFLTGATIHLTADAMQTKLLEIGYDVGKTAAENFIILGVPEHLMHVFQMLYNYDEFIGHNMWYIAYFIILGLFICASLVPKPLHIKSLSVQKHRSTTHLPLWVWLTLVPLGGLFHLYAIVEGRSWLAFLITYVIVQNYLVYKSRRNMQPDINGKYVLYMFHATLLLFLAWVAIFHGVPEFWEVVLG